MRTQKILFSNQQSLCIFPDDRSHLAQAISMLGLEDGYPVIVLIGGGIQEQQAVVTQQAIQILAKIAEDMNAMVICGGTDMGVMADIGQERGQNQYTFPLVGITLEALVTWPDGPRSTNFLWWGKKRWMLAPHYSHFILVPGTEFGDESPWIVDAATILSKGNRSVTVLMNGGEVSRKDIELSVENGRRVIALGGTGRLANELASESNIHNLISVVPVNIENRVDEAVRSAISVIESSAPSSTSITSSAWSAASMNAVARG
jgi:hypothetical protein